MANNSFADYSTTPALNTDIAGTSIAVGCPPADVGVYCRTLLAQIAYNVQGTPGLFTPTWHVGTLTATTVNTTNFTTTNFTPSSITTASLSATTIAATGSSSAGQFVPTGSSVPTAGIYQTGANELAFASGSGYRMKFDATGVTYFNTTVPNPIASAVGGMTIDVGDSVIINSIAVPMSLGINAVSRNILQFFTSGASLAGAVFVSGTSTFYNSVSDERLKIKIGRIEYLEAADIVERLAALWFEWRDGDGEVNPGFFAQQVYRICPWAVTKGRGRPGSKNFVAWQMDASKMMPFVIAYIQGLGKRVSALEKIRS